MKIIKFYLLIYLTVLFFQSSDTVNASTSNQQLLKRGYPSSVIEKLDDDLKQSLLQKSDFYFIESSFTSMLPETHNLKLDWVYSAKYNENNEIIAMDIIYFYEWINLPIWRLQDRITLSWMKTDFQLKPDSFVKVDLYDTLMTIGNIYSFEMGYANASPINVSWYANLKGNYFIIVTKLYGYCQFELIPTENVISVVPNFKITYDHNIPFI